jgi:outer membrane lipoprotein-sorting protein
MMKRALSAFLVAMLVTFSAKAQSPTAEKIVDRYIEAIGGAKKWKALRSMRLTVTLRTQGIDLPGEVYATADGKQRMEFTYSGMKMIRAYDGTTAWTLDQFSGMTAPVKLEGDEAADLVDEEFLDEFIDYKKNGAVISYLGKEEYEGLHYHKVSKKEKGGEEAVFLFDEETGLLLLKRETTDGQQIETQYQDYTEVDGLTMPMKVIGKSGGQILQSFIVTNAELDIEVASEMFAFPGK